MWSLEGRYAMEKKMKSRGIAITSSQIDGETMETVRDYMLGSIITADGDCNHEI